MMTESDMGNLFSRRLRMLREKSGMSARQMSLQLTRSESLINQFENGKAFPSMSLFFKICAFLDVHPGEFFNPNQFSINTDTDYQKKLDGLVGDMSNHDAKIVYDFLSAFRRSR